MSTNGEIQDSELVDITSNEWKELFCDADRYGKRVAEVTLLWFNEYWTDRGFAVDPVTGMPDVNRDILMHAGAVTSIWLWQERGYLELVCPHILTLEEAVFGFGDRMNAVDHNRDSGEGAALWKKVVAFERQRRVPSSQQALPLDTNVAMAAMPPSDAGLEAIAKLLLDFSHLTCTGESI